MRIGGLASGIDTDSIIKDLMRAERIPLDKMEQNKTTLEWQRDAYREINTMLFELDEMAFDLKLESNFKTKSFHSTQENAVTARGGANAGVGNYQIEVERLATTAMNVSTNQLAYDIDTVISDEYAGKTYSFYTINEEQQAVQHTFTIDQGDTIRDVVDKINEDPDNNIRLNYDATTNKIVMETTRTGQYNPRNVDGESEIPEDLPVLTFVDENGEPIDPPPGIDEKSLSNEIIFDSSMNSFFTEVLNLSPAGENGGTDAKITYNNYHEVDNLKENTYTINDVTFELHAVTNGPATVNVQNDVDDTVEKITEFVDKYNELVEKVNEKVRENKYRDYPPLTDAQREEMEEREIELWEEKAKSGILRGDMILSSLLTDLRQNWYAVIDTGGKFNTLSQIGIQTTSDYMDGGKLEIDEDELRKALEEDPESVFNLFSNSGEDEERGILNRLEDTMDRAMERINRRAGRSTDSTLDSYSLGRRISDVDDRMAAFEDRLKQIEDRYWRQFSQMEQAISMMNQQSMMLMSNFMPQ